MQNILLFIISVLIWGSTWLAINFQLGEVAPEVSVFYRQVLASSLLFAWAVLRRTQLRFAWRDHLWFFLLGLTLFGFNYVLAYSAQKYVSSATNAVLFATMVWINVLLSRVFFRTPFEWHVVLGAVLGMAGVVVLFWPSLVEAVHQGPSLVGIAISLTGATVASCGNMVAHQAQQERLPVLQSNAWGMFYGALVTGLWALLTGKPFHFETSFEYVASLLYLSIVGSVIAFGCYLRLIGRIGPSRAGYIAVVVPIIAVLLSIAFEDMQLNGYIVSGFVLVLGGNLMILLFRRIRIPRRPL